MPLPFPDITWLVADEKLTGTPQSLPTSPNGVLNRPLNQLQQNIAYLESEIIALGSGSSAPSGSYIYTDSATPPTGYNSVGVTQEVQTNPNPAVSWDNYGSLTVPAHMSSVGYFGSTLVTIGSMLNLGSVDATSSNTHLNNLVYEYTPTTSMGSGTTNVAWNAPNTIVSTYSGQGGSLQGLFNAGTVTVGDKIYCLHGDTESSNLSGFWDFRYWDITNQVWSSPLADLEPVLFAAINPDGSNDKRDITPITHYNGDLFIFIKSNNNFDAYLMKYNIAGDSWTYISDQFSLGGIISTLTATPDFQKYVKLFTVGDFIYFIYNIYGSYEVFRIDPNSPAGSGTHLTTSPQVSAGAGPVSYFAGYSDGNSNIYVSGGNSNNILYGTATPDNFYYNVSTDSWTSLPDLVTGLYGHSLIAKDGDLIALGGKTVTNVFNLGVRKLYDAVSKTLTLYLHQKT